MGLKLMRVQWEWYKVSMRKMRNAYGILVTKSVGKTPYSI